MSKKKKSVVEFHDPERGFFKRQKAKWRQRVERWKGPAQNQNMFTKKYNGTDSEFVQYIYKANIITFKKLRITKSELRTMYMAFKAIDYSMGRSLADGYLTKEKMKAHFG